LRQWLRARSQSDSAEGDLTHKHKASQKESARQALGVPGSVVDKTSSGVAWHVPLGVFNHQIEVPALIVEERKRRAQNNYANSSEQKTQLPSKYPGETCGTRHENARQLVCLLAS
jgi:hypothetical protein